MANTIPAQSPTDWNATVAANVRAELARNGLNQSQLATALGLSEMWISRRLKGGTKLDADDIAMFADFFNVSVADLFAPAKMAPTPKGEGQMVPSGRIELPTYSLQADGFAVTPMLTVAADHDDSDSDAIHSVTPIRRLA